MSVNDGPETLAGGGAAGTLVIDVPGRTRVALYEGSAHATKLDEVVVELAGAEGPTGPIGGIGRWIAGHPLITAAGVVGGLALGVSRRRPF